MELDKPGNETSEYKTTRLIIIFGAVLTGAGAVLEQLPNNEFTSVAMVIVGGLMAVMTALGYTRSRTNLKITAMQSMLPPLSISPRMPIPMPRIPVPTPVPVTPTPMPVPVPVPTSPVTEEDVPVPQAFREPPVV